MLIERLFSVVSCVVINILPNYAPYTAFIIIIVMVSILHQKYHTASYFRQQYGSKITNNQNKGGLFSLAVTLSTSSYDSERGTEY